jgi:NTE family protein
MSKKKKIGLALSGGGARGFAHLGVLRVLEQRSIPIDVIAGTSAGSLAGAGIAAGLSAEELIDVGRKITWLNMTRPAYSPRALLSNAVMGSFIRKHYPARTFEDLRIPFAATACDMRTGEVVVLKDAGDLAIAVRASCAVPGVFLPLDRGDGRLLVDGGVVVPVPTGVAREMGADVVIAVDLLASGASFRSAPRTLVGMLFQSAMFMLRAASKAQHYHADVVVVPEIGHFRPDELGKREQLIKLGEEAALAAMPQIEAALD